MSHWIQRGEWAGARNKSGQKVWPCECSGCGFTGLRRKDIIENTNGCRSCCHKHNDRVSTTDAYIFRALTRNAKSRGISVRITVEDMATLSRQPCQYCGLEASNCVTCQGEAHWYNGIDRVDNGRGYEDGNVVACCKYCNQAKSNQSVDDFLDHARRICNHQKLR